MAITNEEVCIRAARIQETLLKIGKAEKQTPEQKQIIEDVAYLVTNVLVNLNEIAYQLGEIANRSGNAQVGE
jgi:hypothetical protein